LGGVLLGWQPADHPGTSGLAAWMPEQESGYRIRSNQFGKEEEGDESRLSYFWWDHGDNPYTVVFSLSKAAIQESVDEFGYYPADMNAYVEPRLEPRRTRMLSDLKKYVLKLLARSTYGHYYYIQDDAALSFKLKIMTPPTLSEAELDSIRVEFQKIVRAVARKQEPYIKKIQNQELKIKQEFLEARGFRLQGRELYVNYSWVIKRNRDRISNLIEGLKREVRSSSLREFLSLLLAFVQSIGYGTPPLDEADKVILGFWPPPKVLVNNYGDCDSKGALFASVWTQFRHYPLLLIRIPEHLFVGIALPSFQGEQFTINGLRYTFCEVTGPELIPPGFLSPLSRFYLERGGFHYELLR